VVAVVDAVANHGVINAIANIVPLAVHIAIIAV
jgi:hypothetical protein